MHIYTALPKSPNWMSGIIIHTTYILEAFLYNMKFEKNKISPYDVYEFGDLIHQKTEEIL